MIYETMTSDRNINEDEENLRSAATNGNWQKVLDMYKEKKELRTAKITKGDTVLHMAVSSGKEYAVESMVDIVCGERINKQDETSTSLPPPVDENGNEKKDVLGAKNDQGNTPLHLAASIGNVRMCKKIVGRDSPLIGDEKKLVLGAQNEKGNTPLHLAASMGNDEICKVFGGANPSLIAERNHAAETPLFLAIFHGHREAFLCLHYQYMGSPGGVSSTDIAHFIKRDNDYTILHCALEEEHIDVAIEIVLLYKDNLKEMTMMRNKNGLSPLHILAATPSAFKSTDLPNRSYVIQLLYHGFFRVKKKERATTSDELEQRERKSCFSSNRTRVSNALFWLYMILLCPLFALSCSFVVKVRGNWFLRKQYRKEERRDRVSSNKRTTSSGICHEGYYWVAKISHLISESLCYLLNWVVNIIQLISYTLCCLAMMPLFPLFALGYLFEAAGNWFRGIRNIKEKHTWSLQIMEQLLFPSCKCLCEKLCEEENEAGSKIIDTPLMIAAKNGVVEMVERILKIFPSTKEVVNKEGKDIVLLAAEKRQTKLYQILCENEYYDKSDFGQVDKDGNTALHLAAKLGVNLDMQATTMVEEYKWFEFVKSSVPSELWEKYNKDGKTAEEIFRDSYKEHMKSDRQWLNQTSQTCSVASTLVASMAFSNIVAENFDKKNISSLLALSLSLTSTISFLAILAFRSQSLNFWRYAPFMLQIAILTMFGSIVALWISLMLNGHSLTTYAILGLPIAILTMVSLPIFIGPTLMSLFTKVPPPSRNTSSAIYYQRPQKQGTATDSNPQN